MSKASLKQIKELSINRIKNIIKRDGSLKDNCSKNILEEWDYKKNKKNPNEYTTHSKAKVWWICKNNHSWEASIGSRTRKNGNNCKKCSGHGVSKLEFRILCELEKIFKNVNYHKIIEKLELDIFLPDYKIAIEADGFIHHKVKTKKFDVIKNQKLKSKKIETIRIRDHRLPKINKYDVLMTKNSMVSVNDIKNLLNSITKVKNISSDETKKIREYFKTKNFIADKEFNFLVNNLPAPPYKLSLEYLNPDISMFWDYNKNFPIKPSMVKPGSNEKVWWICPECKKSHKANIYNKVLRNTVCKKCGNKKNSKGQIKYYLKKYGSIHDKRPELAKMFLEKENNISAKDIPNTPGGGGIMYWFYCEIHKYKFRTTTQSLFRKKHYCKYCSIDKGLFTKNRKYKNK